VKIDILIPLENSIDFSGTGMKSATFAEIKKAIVLSALVHAAIFSLALFSVRQQDYPFGKKYIAVELVLPWGKKTTTGSGSNRPKAATPTASIQPKVQGTETGSDDPLRKGAHAVPDEAQTATQPGGEAASAGQGAAGYLPFYKLEKAPSFKIQKTPVYPFSARSAGAEARVVVEVYINDQGNVDDVKLIKSGGAGFDQAVIAAVRESSFEPGIKDGRTVASKVQIPYLFKLK
jgi:TonB family protein